MTDENETNKDDLPIYILFRDYIKHEDNLINNRMTWMLTIHGFLYATYGFTLQKLLETYEKSANEIAKAVCDRNYVDVYTGFYLVHYTVWEARFFLVCIALVGMAISGFAFYSIRAAYDAVFNIAWVFNDYSAAKPDGNNGSIYDLMSKGQIIRAPLLTGGGLPGGAKGGVSAAWWIPFTLIISWIASLVFLAGQGYFASNEFKKERICVHYSEKLNPEDVLKPPRI